MEVGNQKAEGHGEGTPSWEIGGVSLREYQFETLNGVRAAYADGSRAPLLMAPTGSGKTRMGCALVRGARQKSKTVYWICDRLELIDQASATFDANSIEHGVIQGNHPRWRPWERVQVISIQTAARRKLPAPDFCVIDEAHVLHQAHIKLMQQWTETKFLGLSATPFTEGLAKHFDRLVQGPSVSALIEMGFLVPFEVWCPTEPDLTGIKVTAGEYDQDALAEAMNKPKLIGDIIQHWVEKAGNRQTIAFAVDVAHSKHIAEQFRAIGVDARHIDGYMPLEERSPIIAAFRKGEFRVLTNCGIVDKGFDCPEASCLIQARPIRKSLALHIQQIGRVLRICEGKKDAVILDHAGNHLRHGMATDPLPTELDDGKRKKKEAKKREAMPTTCPACKYLKPPKVHTCPRCNHQPERQNVEFAEGGELQAFRGGEQRTQAIKELLFIANEKGYSKGWAAHQYRKLFGDWPRFGFEREKPQRPSEWLQDWVKKQQRAYNIRRSYAERRV
jgi:DNA repair protein RadD